MTAKIEDIWHLQTQVDLLAARYDLVASLAPLLLEYLKKVDCESDQRLRELTNALMAIDGKVISESKFMKPEDTTLPQKAPGHRILGSEVLRDLELPHKTGVPQQRALADFADILSASKVDLAFIEAEAASESLPVPWWDTLVASSDSSEDRRSFASPKSSCGGEPRSASPMSSSGGFHDDTASDRFTEPGTGGTALSTSEVIRDLVCGKGSWATAYQKAQGVRRQALQMLCTSGIVTPREVKDDLTVISEEHIDECILIATEMLQQQPPDVWTGQSQAAKEFFEARLTELYQEKLGSPREVW